MPTKISPLAKEKLKKASELQLPQTLKNKVTLFVLIGLAVAVFITGLIILILFAAGNNLQFFKLICFHEK